MKYIQWWLNDYLPFSKNKDPWKKKSYFLISQCPSQLPDRWELSHGNLVMTGRQASPPADEVQQSTDIQSAKRSSRRAAAINTLLEKRPRPRANKIHKQTIGNRSDLLQRLGKCESVGVVTQLRHCNWVGKIIVI